MATGKSGKRVFSRLYEEHENLKRKKVKQQIHKQMEEESKYSFHPERVTKAKDSEFGFDGTKSEISHNDLYEKLYRDAELQTSKKLARQEAARRELHEMSRFSSLSYKYSGKKNKSLMFYRKL